MRRRTATERTDFEAIADRLAVGLGEHEPGVGAQRVEIDEGERRGDGVEDRLVAGVERLAVGCGSRCRGTGAGRTHRGASVSSADR